MNQHQRLQDQAAADPGIPKVSYHTAPTGDIAGIAIAVGIHGPHGEIVVSHTVIPFVDATGLRDDLTTLLNDIDHTANIDPEAQ